jgi:hypothetical protein
MTTFKQFFEEARTIRLYRGMSLEAFERIRKTGVYTPELRNPHNDATTNLETAQYYASTKVHDDSGVVIEFEVPVNAVKQDSVTPEDYKVLKPIRLKSYKVLRSNSSNE